MPTNKAMMKKAMPTIPIVISTARSCVLASPSRPTGWLRRTKEMRAKAWAESEKKRKMGTRSSKVNSSLRGS